MLTLTSPEVVQATCLRWKPEFRVALVPTMGCLHEGHLSLIRLAKSIADKVVVSLFVNPLQFGPTEDLSNYPRSYNEDCQLLREEGVDLLFNPSQQELYPQGFQTKIKVGVLAQHLCGSSRPGHFDGVATVCLKLFEITQAQIAIFGEKDFQQLAVIRQLVSDFNLPLSIISHAIVRERDGLALSSRNRYLNPEERNLAPKIFAALELEREKMTTPQITVGDVVKQVTEALPINLIIIDYVAICSEADLSPCPVQQLIETISKPRLFVAVKIGHTRLIDNAPLYS